jgi:hypothetical protein
MASSNFANFDTATPDLASLCLFKIAETPFQYNLLGLTDQERGRVICTAFWIHSVRYVKAGSSSFALDLQLPYSTNVNSYFMSRYYLRFVRTKHGKQT